MIEPTISTIRLTQFAKSLKREKRTVLAELQAFQANTQIKFLFRNHLKGKSSPWYISINKLFECGYLNNRLMISQEAKQLKQEISELEGRVSELEDSNGA